MSIENLNHYWHPGEIDEPTENRVEDLSPTPDECQDHFKTGPKILPAFRILAKAFDTAHANDLSVSTIYLRMGDMLPQDVPYRVIKRPINPLSNSGAIELARDKRNTLLEFDLIDQQTYLLPKTLPESSCPDISPNDVALDKTQVQQIIPQGPTIQFIDGILTPTAHTQAATTIEGFHKITADDFKTVPNTAKPDSPDRFQFNLAPTLEGFGQLVYVHFQNEIKPTEPMVPFFTHVIASFNTYYQPKLNEPIYYVLDKFDTDFAERGDKGKGVITGRVLAGDHQTVIAAYTAHVGALKQKLFDYTVNKIIKSAHPADPGLTSA